MLQHLKVDLHGGSWCSATFSVLWGGGWGRCCGLYAVLRNLNLTTLLTYIYHEQKIYVRARTF